MGPEEVFRERPAHGLQALMRRWEQLHPVNAVQIAHLRLRLSPSRVCGAAECVFGRLGPAAVPRFEFQLRPFAGDWRGVLDAAVTGELNRPYDNAESPWRLMLFESTRQGQFLALGYRHFIADARSTALVLHEIIRQTLTPSDVPTGHEAEHHAVSLPQMFPNDFRLRRVPAMITNHLSEMCASLRAFRAPCSDPRDLRMEFRSHDLELSLAGLKRTCRRFDATINDLISAALLEWLARRFPLDGRGRRPDLAVAVLADLTGRSARTIPRAFGQYLSQFAIRLPVTVGMSFGDIVRLIARRGQAAKQVAPLIDNARGFSLIARLWDLIPYIRRPEVLPALIPLLGGVSSVNLNAIVNDHDVQSAIRSYFRGTCVTHVLPMIVSMTTSGESCTMTTTHRQTVFDHHDMTNLISHIGDRLSHSNRSVVRAAA